MADKKMSVLMCRPDFFGIEYEINPWMDEKNAVVSQTAHQQWEKLYDMYTIKLGWDVQLVAPQAGLPDMVFTANGALIYGKKAILPNFRHHDRQGETAHFKRWFENAGFEVCTTKYDFEGEGDALFFRDILFVGYPWRTDKASHRELADILKVEVVSLQLTDPRFYHLDTALTIINDETVAIYEPAFTQESVREIRAKVRHVITGSELDALTYGLNAISDGKNIVISDGSKHLIKEYIRRGFSVHPTPIGEFQKAGGGVKCLSLVSERIPKIWRRLEMSEARTSA